MAFIDLIEKEDAPPEVLAAYEKGEAVYGRVLETWKAIAHNPAIYEAYLPYVRAVFGSGTLDSKTKDLVALRISFLNHCRYSLSHRVASARAQGLTEQEITGVADPHAHPYDPNDLAALDYAEELTLLPSQIAYTSNPQAVSSEVLMTLKEHFSDAQISELTVTIGLWNALNRFHRVLDLDLDMPPPPEELDPALG